jgi:hypothetical protein
MEPVGFRARRRHLVAGRHLSAYPDQVAAPDLKSNLIGHLDRLNQAVLHKLASPRRNCADR